MTSSPCYKQQETLQYLKTRKEGLQHQILLTDKQAFTIANPHSCDYCALNVLSEQLNSYMLPQPKGARQAPIHNEEFHLHDDIQGACRAAQAGCAFYQWILDDLLLQYPPPGNLKEKVEDLRNETFMLKSRYLYGKEPQLGVEIRISSARAVSVTPGIFACAEEGNSAADDVLTRPMDFDVASPKNLPTRLLELQVTADGDLKVKLLEKGNAKPDVQKAIAKAGFAALSYCWGGPQEPSLTSHTQDRLRAEMDASRVSRTINDAIKFTHVMGFKYLWVDALCILQDSPHDKATEIGRSSSYYDADTVTLLATSASATTQGFLEPRSDQGKHAVGPFWFPYRTASGKLGSVLLYNELGPASEPILTRGWTLQESLLSYSLRSLGVAADKLPAVSAVAEKSVKRLCRYYGRPIHYLAGLFHDPEHPETLMTQLLWAALKPKDMTPYWHGIASHNCNYRAPSWSWASVDGPVTHVAVGSMFYYCGNRVKTQVLAAKVQATYPTNPYGMISDGFLEVKGPLLTLSPEGVELQKLRPFMKIEQPDEWQPSKRTLSLSPDTENEKKRVEPILNGSLEEPLMLLTILISARDTDSALGLVIKPAATEDGNHSDTCYKRVGVFAKKLDSNSDQNDYSKDQAISAFFDRGHDYTLRLV
ncbi:het-domain-containing protein [Colletotrichum incanum]|uniref:Het-domain-containing protein n=1 Tax=Colletotrichum incanum TaxID=1573173 RepID=A0A166ZZK9_COLIC|nr:het-domain-containing protein [Colletotrichum incanum]